MHRGKQKHPDDFSAVLGRAKAAGVEQQIITGGSLSESRAALKLAREHNLFATTGCHPTRSSEVGRMPEGQYMRQLDKLIADNLYRPGEGPKGRCVAVGECGLDYDRLFRAGKDDQKKAFRAQLAIAKKYHLPLFLHNRNSHADFVALLSEAGMHIDGGRAVGGRGGVVHSFTGEIEEMEEFVSMGYYISVNGCSMKTEALLEMIKRIPLGRLLLETGTSTPSGSLRSSCKTDAPWCSLTGGHASKEHLTLLPQHLRKLFIPLATQPERWEEGKAVRGRNEPCAIGSVAFVVARCVQCCKQLHSLSLFAGSRGYT